ncbi:hypothetical protein SDC9_152518 [bioreactor metagenome]|uniref:Uncharacterized protein n=1 Tax=bioreactor metagenome TaxID=1076179 RepID=A0A645ETA0_9ZZZZ
MGQHTQKQILGDGEIPMQADLLMDHLNAVFLRVVLAAKLAFLAPNKELAFVFAHRVNAGEYIHHGRFASAVFADNRQNFTLIEIQAHLMKHRNLAKVLGDLLHFEYLFHSCHSS